MLPVPQRVFIWGVKDRFFEKAVNIRRHAIAYPLFSIGRSTVSTIKTIMGRATPKAWIPEIIGRARGRSNCDRPHASGGNRKQVWSNRQQRHHRGRPSPKTFFAGLIGIGCTIGSRKMARISHSINESELEHTINWYFSVDNTHAANDQVLRLIDRLGLPNISRRSSDRLHTSSDGQKFEVRAESLNANYSFKYFGKGQGVSVYSFIDERDLLFHSLVFSALGSVRAHTSSTG